MTYVVGEAPPETVPVPCAQEVAVGESIPSCVQEALSAEFAAVVAMADGPPIAFVSERDGDWEIYTMRTDGTDVRQLTVNDVGDWHAAWSPDGTRIAFGSDCDGDKEIYTMRPDGTDVHQLTKNRRHAPTWSR